MYIGKIQLSEFFNLPQRESLNRFGVALITVGATLLGFLLTIITVIITFKDGFKRVDNATVEPLSRDEEVTETVFEKIISKEEKFYGTKIYKKVVQVFINGTYEIGFVMFILLLMQFNFSFISLFWSSIISLSAFIILVLTIIRSLYIFRLFLNVHMPEKQV